MIREALELLLTPTSPTAKKYGFLYHSIALKHRYNRCKTVWLPHLKNCQDIFHASLKNLEQKQSVIILGSAHLHEIPLHLLLKNFSSVTLVDVVHPLKHHWMSKRDPRIKLVTQDLGGSLNDLDKVNSLEDMSRLIEDLSNQQQFYFEADLIISGNLISQLALLPMEALEKKRKQPLSIEEKDQICTAFAKIHLNSLRKCKGNILVYTDREVSYRNPKNEVIYQGSYPVNFEGFEKLNDWKWLLAPLKEASKDYSIEMKVEAYHHSTGSF